MFDGRDIPESLKACRRDYEGEIARDKARLAECCLLRDAITRFFTQGPVYEIFDNHREQEPFLALLGGLSLYIPRTEAIIEKLIKEYESEKE